MKLHELKAMIDNTLENGADPNLEVVIEGDEFTDRNPWISISEDATEFTINVDEFNEHR